MDTIYITKNDHKKLVGLINRKFPLDDDHKALLDELRRATIVEPEEIPNNVITMNSLVRLTDADSGSTVEYTLVFPQDMNLAEKKISVLSPVGCALLGYQVGNLVSLKTPTGKRKFKVVEILHQPETVGKFD